MIREKIIRLKKSDLNFAYSWNEKEHKFIISIGHTSNIYKDKTIEFPFSQIPNVLCVLKNCYMASLEDNKKDIEKNLKKLANKK